MMIGAQSCTAPLSSSMSLYFIDLYQLKASVYSYMRQLNPQFASHSTGAIHLRLEKAGDAR